VEAHEVVASLGVQPVHEIGKERDDIAMSEDILTDEQVAELLHCHVQTVQEWTRVGKLPGIKPGRSWIYPRQALLDALNEMARAKPESNVRTLAVTQRGKPRKVPPLLPVI
jgi:excisionase family DNA binding protein